MRSQHLSTLTITALLLAVSFTASGASASHSPASDSAMNHATQAPSAIKLGTVYAGSGSYAAQSLAEYHGLQVWIESQNAKGGAYVGAYNKRIPIKLVAYNDQSSPSTAATFYSRLITQDKVDVLVSDFGSVLTAPAITISKNNKVLLFNVSGTGAAFYKEKNPYVVLTSYPTSAIWPTSVWDFIIANKLDKTAILYATNDYTASQAMAIKEHIIEAGLKPVYFQGTATDTSSYASLVAAINASGAESVFEFGYPANDMSFLRALKSASKAYKYVFASDAGNAFPLYMKNLGEDVMQNVISYGYPPAISYNNPSVGMATSKFMQVLKTKYPTTVESAPNSAIAGYTAGLVIQTALKHATDMSQLSLRKALDKVSGKMTTLSGIFKIDPETGAQLGEFLPLAQAQQISGVQGLQLKVVAPKSMLESPVVKGWPASGK